jgi:D-tagatose-1,6-bisphosphate aldolase subunit GatZ/KbaZ
MQDQPDNWKNYYSGDDTDLWMQRHFSYSDRIRYYWPSERARAAVSELKSRLDNKTIPGPLVSQFLGNLTEERLENDADKIQVAAVQHVLKKYERAIAS